LSGAAINIIVAPWFDRRPWVGCELGAERSERWRHHYCPTADLPHRPFGFAFAILSVSASMLAILIPVEMVVLRPRRTDEDDPMERTAGSDKAPQFSTASAPEAGFRLTTLLRSGCSSRSLFRFALGLTAQVGFLTHQIGFLSPTIGTVRCGLGGQSDDVCRGAWAYRHRFLSPTGSTGEPWPVSTLSCRCLGWRF